MSQVVDFDTDGYVILPDRLGLEWVRHLRSILDSQMQSDSSGNLAHSQSGWLYAARNVLASAPEIKTLLTVPLVQHFVTKTLGAMSGLVRALYFDKPPDQSWSLPWHKDQSIAVAAHGLLPSGFSRPTVKRGVPHLIAPDDVLREMVTLRIHLDAMSDENGPLQVVPRSHHSSSDQGSGVENRRVIHAEVGEVLAMRPLLTHASGLSKPGTTQHRRILHLEFAAGPLPEPLQWYEFHPVSHNCERTGDVAMSPVGKSIVQVK